MINPKRLCFCCLCLWVEGRVVGQCKDGVFVASRSISQGLGLIFGLTLLAMTNEWGDTVLEESVLLGKLRLCLTAVIPLLIDIED